MSEFIVRLSLDDVRAIAIALADELEHRGLSSSNGDRDWLTYDEAGERLGKSPDAVRMLCDRGRLERRRLGRSAFVSAESVRRLEAIG